MLNPATPPVSADEPGILSLADKQQYHRDGFLLIKDFLSHSICAMLMTEAQQLINDNNTDDLKTIFSTTNRRHHQARFFLDSGDKIRCFYEEAAILEDGSLKTDKRFCINKIGHALHDLNPIFNCFSRQHKLAVLTQELAINNPLLIQSMYIFKQPFFGGEVTCHQDSTYLYTHGEPITGFWFALEDANLTNGCLWAIPGGHQGPLKSRLFRDQNDCLSTEVYDDSPWPLEKMVPLEAPRGSLIILNGLLPHMSKQNHSPHSRQAYTLHVSSSHGKFAENNWLMRATDMPFQGFL